MTTGYGTGFTESEAILAVQQGDIDYARELIARMLPGERSELAAAADNLAALLHVNSCMACDPTQFHGRYHFVCRPGKR